MTTKRATKAKIGSKSQKITVVSFTMLFFVMCARAASWSYSSQGFIEIPEITEDSTLTISSGVTVTNTAALTGVGKLTVKGGGTLVLTEDSPNFFGNVYVGKAMVSIRNGGALGTGSVTIQGKTNADGTSCICFDNGSSAMAVANNFVIESAGERDASKASMVFAGDGSGSVTLCGRVEGESGATTVLWGGNDTTVTFENLVSSDTVTCCGTVYYYFKGKVKAGLLWAYSVANGGYKSHVYLSNGMSEIGILQSRANATIDFHADNAAGGAVLIFGGKGLNLNGYSQLASSISMEQAYSINGGDGDSIATLTLTGGVSSSSSALLKGNLNLVVDDQSAGGDFVQIQSGGAHTMSGKIDVNRGTYSITGAATFRKLKGLSIGASGKLCIAPETGMPFPNECTIDVAFSTGAQYEGNPVEINAKSLTLDGVLQEPGCYTHDDSPAIPEGVTVLTLNTLTLGASGEIDFAGTQGAIDGYWLVTVPSGVAVTNTTALTAASGSSVIEFTGGGTFVQLAESPNFDANVCVGKATLVVTKSNALGMGSVTVNGYDKENGTSRLYFDNGDDDIDFPNDINIKVGCESYSSDVPAKAAIVFAGGEQGKVTLSGKIVTGKDKFVFYGYNDTAAEFSNEAIVSELYLYGNTYYDFIGAVTAEMLYAYSGAGSSGHPPAKLRLRSSENDIAAIKARKKARVDIYAPNAIGGAALVFSNSKEGTGRGVRLNGNSQTAAYVDNEGSADAGLIDGGDGDEVAILTVTGGVAAAMTMVELRDKLSLVVDDKGPSGDFVQVFSNGVHTMSGAITVKRGTLELKGDATFKKVSSVEVEGGELVLATDSATFGSETEVRAGNIDMMISAGGRVTVSDGLTVNVNKANVGGLGLPSGNYTGIGGPAGAKVLPQLGGTGILHVCKTSGMGFVVILK